MPFWEGRRIPNPPPCLSPFFLGVEGLKVVSWNGRGICHNDPVAWATASTVLQNIGRQAHVLCLQEVHGHEKEVVSQLGLWLPGWKFWASMVRRYDGSANYGAGGVVIGFCTEIAQKATSASHTVLIKGRLLGLTLGSAG